MNQQQTSDQQGRTRRLITFLYTSPAGRKAQEAYQQGRRTCVDAALGIHEIWTGFVVHFIGGLVWRCAKGGIAGIVESWRWFWRRNTNEKATIIIAVATTVYAIVAASQLITMRRSLEASERAWVLPVASTLVYQPLKMRGIAGAFYCFGRIVGLVQNFGKGPAFDLEQISLLPHGDGLGPTVEPPPSGEPRVHRVIFPPGETQEQSVMVCAIGKAAAKEFHHSGLYLRTNITYRDQFGIARHTQLYFSVRRGRNGEVRVDNVPLNNYAD